MAEGEQRFSQWSPEVNALADICDKLSQVVNVLLVANGGTALKMAPYPRPKSAIQAAQVNRSRRMHEHLVERLTPKE